MNKWLSECIGTFCLVFAGTGAMITHDLSGGVVSVLGIGLVFGLIVIAMIYSLGEISGAHINPAVTIAFWVAGRFPAKEVTPYIISQFIGALLASFVLKFLFPTHESLGATLPSGSTQQSFILEFILTFILMFVILRVATGSKEKGLTAGLIIGGVVALEATFAGPICGASMNPARSLGPAVASFQYEHLWLYLVAPTLGAVTAVFVERVIQPDEV